MVIKYGIKCVANLFFLLGNLLRFYNTHLIIFCREILLKTREHYKIFDLVIHKLYMTQIHGGWIKQNQNNYDKDNDNGEDDNNDSDNRDKVE